MQLSQLVDKTKVAFNPKNTDTDKLSLLLSDKTRETQSVYRSQIAKFQSWKNKDRYDKWDILTYIKHLKDKGFSTSYIRGTFFALKLFFESQGWPWEAKLPKLKDTKIVKPALPKEDVIKLIETAKQGGAAEEIVYLALSSVYGLRRLEMANLTPDDFDFSANTIFVRTKKGGMPRKHLIPPQILHLLHSFDFGRTLSCSSLNIMFKIMCVKAGVYTEKGINFHSIRHRLNIELVEAGLPEITILEFLRWKYRMSMAQYYYTPDQRALDSKVFSVHPFLQFWDSNN